MASWGQKYEIGIKDTKGLEWTVKIYEDGYSPPPITILTATGTPLIFEYLSDSDDLFELIHETNVKINVFSSSNFALADLYSTEDMHFLIRIYNGATLRFEGYVNCGDYAEPYEDYPYPVTITASCGLTFLKEIKYDDDGTPYTGRILESQIILDILGKIGFTEFKEYVNLYEESMDDDTGDSPFDQIKIDVDCFTDMYCYEVLQEILKKYGACIRQKDGIFCIYRPVELTGATVYGRYFTGATTKSSVSLTPQKYINRTAHSSDMIQIPGGVQMVLNPAKKITIHQDYGLRESWIRNWEFAPDKWSGGGIAVWDAENWTRNGLAAGEIYPIGGEVPESNGVVLTNVNDYGGGDYTHYIYQSFGEFIITESAVMCLEFEYQWFNRSGAKRNSQTFYWHLKADDADYSLEEDDDSYASWVTPEGSKMNTTEDVEDGDSGWQTWRRLIPGGIDAAGSYTIRFYAPDDTYAISVGIRNVKFTATNDIISVKKIIRAKQRKFMWGLPFMWGAGFEIQRMYFLKNYPDVVQYRWIKENSINGTEKEYDMMLGDTPKSNTSGQTDGTGIDNNLEQFKGSLAVQASDLTDAAADFVTAHAADYYPAASVFIIVTSDGRKIIFTSETPGANFGGETTISNTSGDLTGTVEYTVANKAAVPQIDRILLEGFNGRADVGTELGTKEMEFDTDLETTCDNFITDYAADMLAVNGVILSKTVEGSDVYLVMTDNVPGTGFTAEITNTSGSLDGTVYHEYQEYEAAVARVDTIILQGSYGTADITCDGITEEVEAELADIEYTTDWNTRGGSESTALLDIISDEMKAQFARPRQLIQFSLMDKAAAAPSLDVLGCYEDDLNDYGGNNRKFVVSRGTFDIKSKRLNIDMIEVI